MKVVVAVTGSVAACRVVDLVRELIHQGVEVECAMSAAARNILNPWVLQWASGKKVITEITGAVEHVRLLGLEGEADTLLICPATSNTVSKIAHGIDDTVVTTLAATAVGSGKRVVVVPAMHQSMYDNPFVSENIEKLRKNGVVFVEPRVEDNKAKIASQGDILSALKD